MANICINTLIVKGDTEKLQQFDKQFKSSFEQVVGREIYLKDKSEPLPENILDYQDNPIPNREAISRVILKSIETVNDEYSFNNFIPITKQDFLNGWTQWSDSNWGTRRDLEMLDAPEDIPVDLDEIRYVFNTSWEPSIPVTIEMFRQFPDLEFIHQYEENGNQIAGVFERSADDESHIMYLDSGMEYIKFLHVFLDEDVYYCENCKTYHYVYQVEDNNMTCPNCDSKDVKYKQASDYVKY